MADELYEGTQGNNLSQGDGAMWGMVAVARLIYQRAQLGQLLTRLSNGWLTDTWGYLRARVSAEVDCVHLFCCSTHHEASTHVNDS